MIKEKEMELRDYLEIIIKNKRLIIVGLVFCLLITLVVTIIFSVYETKAIFQNASFELVTPNGQLEKFCFIDNQEINAELRSHQILGEVLAQRGLSFEKFLKNVTVENFKDSALFQIRVQSKNPQDALAVLEGVLDRFFKSGQLLVEQKTEFLKRELAKTNREINELKPLVKETESRLEKEGTPKNSPAYEKVALLSLVYSGQRERLLGEVKRKNTVGNQLASLKGFEIICPPTTPSRHLKKRLVKNLFLSSVAGLFLFTYLAFFLDYWGRSTSE